MDFHLHYSLSSRFFIIPDIFPDTTLPIYLGSEMHWFVPPSANIPIAQFGVSIQFV